MVWWKAVSNTATLGTPLKICWQASMPPRLAGMCNGPNLTSFLHLAITLASTLTESLNTSAPCSTRWPMASMSLGLPRSATTCLSASAWLAGPPAPMRSTRPLARRVWVVMSNSWYLSELEPEFTTSTFLIAFFIDSLLYFLSSIVMKPATSGSAPTSTVISPDFSVPSSTVTVRVSATVHSSARLALVLTTSWKLSVLPLAT